MRRCPVKDRKTRGAVGLAQIALPATIFGGDHIQKQRGFHAAPVDRHTGVIVEHKVKHVTHGHAAGTQRAGAGCHITRTDQDAFMAEKILHRCTGTHDPGLGRGDDILHQAEIGCAQSDRRQPAKA